MNHDEPTIKDVLDAISDFSTNMDGRFDKVDGRLDMVESRLGSIEARLDSIEADLSDLKLDFAKFAKKDQEDSDALNRAYAQMEKRIVELERQVKQLRQANQPRFA